MGEIRTEQLPNGKYRAIANYRDFDGRTRQLERTAKTETGSRNRLKEACRDRGRTDAAAEISAATTVTALAEEWFSRIQTAVDAGEKSPNTGQVYRDRLDNQVIPAIGGLRLREVRVSTIDRVLKTVRERNGVAVAKTTRSVMSGLFALAMRHDAMPANPVRDAERLHVVKKAHRVLTLDEVRDLRAKIAADQKAVDWDLPDLVDMMMATGLRIGETSAITWAAINFDDATVEVRGTVVRIKGKGLVIKLKPKSEAGWRKVQLPTWCVNMLKQRLAEYEPNEWGAVFTSPGGRLRDPSNSQGDLRDVFNRAGYEDISSHTFRRTVATLMDTAGLSARAAADQLGHARVSMTQDGYFGRQIARTGAADLLESVDGPKPGHNEKHG
jgi:integrase